MDVVAVPPWGRFGFDGFAWRGHCPIPGRAGNEPVLGHFNAGAFRMKSLLIVFHSLTGGTRQMAEAAARGAAGEAGTAVTLRSAQDAVPADVLAADGFIFASPENLAAMAGLMKDFFDRLYYPALDRLNGRPYAVLVCAGSDGRNAVRQIERIATGWRLRAVAESIIVCTHAQTPEAILAPKTIGLEDLQRCEDLGAAVAAGMAMGIF
jgi:multimeric flavodoxin WrbA